MNNGSISVKLSRAIKIGTEERKELTFREPTLGALIAAEDAAEGNQHRAAAVLMASMAGISEAEMRQVVVRDYKKMNTDLEPMMGNAIGGDGENSPS